MYNAHKHYQREYKPIQFLVNSPQGVQQVKFLVNSPPGVQQVKFIVNSPQGVQQVKVSHIFEHAVLVRFFGLNSFFTIHVYLRNAKLISLNHSNFI